MQITARPRPAAKVEAEALVSYVFEPEKEQGKPSKASIAELDQAAGGALGTLAASRRTDRQEAGDDAAAFRAGPGRAARCCWSARASARNSARPSCGDWPPPRCAI